MAASFTSSITMALVFLTLIISPAFAGKFESLVSPTSPPLGQESLSPAAQHDPLVLECAASLTFDCASAMYGNVFYHGKINLKCCKQIVKMGETCAFYLVSGAVRSVEDRKLASGIVGHGEQLWNKCAQFVKSAEAPAN